MSDLNPCVPQKEWRFKKFTGCVSLLSFISMLGWLVALTAVTWFAFFKPIMAFLSYKVEMTAEVLETYGPARKEGSPSRIKLEQFTHQDSAVANMMLQSIYQNDAIAKSGIDLKDQQADLGKVDTSKTDELVLQAVREYTDLELMTVLRYSRNIWDESAKPYNDPKLNTTVINREKIDHLTALTKEQKDDLSSCYKKLEEKFSNPFSYLIHLRSIGTCSPYGKHEPTFWGTYNSVFKFAEEVDSDGNII